MGCEASVPEGPNLNNSGIGDGDLGLELNKTIVDGEKPLKDNPAYRDDKDEVA